MSEFFIDGSMLEPGNREAVRQTCDLATDRLREIADEAGVGHDDILDHVLNALGRIAKGESPDEAFGWARQGKGRQPGVIDRHYGATDDRRNGASLKS